MRQRRKPDDTRPGLFETVPGSPLVSLASLARTGDTSRKDHAGLLDQRARHDGLGFSLPCGRFLEGFVVSHIQRL